MTEVVTGEAVVLDLTCARALTRIAALLIDLAIQLAGLGLALFAVLASSGHTDGAVTAALALTCWVVIVVGYPTVFETLTRGQTPGKMVFGLRVVGDDGSPERFRQALIRALTGAVEIWTLVGVSVGLITSIVSVKGKRLGDMFAGTYVIQERAPRRPDLPQAFSVVPPPLLGWAQVAETSRLSDQNADAAGSYLRRFWELSPAARDDLGVRIAAAVAGQVSPPPPPGTPPAAYLSAVLAVRRERDRTRLAGYPPPGAWPPPGAPAGPAPGAGSGSARGPFPDAAPPEPVPEPGQRAPESASSTGFVPPA